MNEEENIINCYSEDRLIIEAIEFIICVFDKLRIEYAIIGSIGIQSYLDYFIRLPNDIDIVILRRDVKKITDYCNKEKIKVVEKPGRIKIITDHITTHIIPGELSIENSTNDGIFAKIDLSKFLPALKVNKVNFFYGGKQILIKVLPIETYLFLELSRPPYTDVLMTLFYTLKYCKIDYKAYVLLLKQNIIFKSVILSNLIQYDTVVDLLTYNNRLDITAVKSKFKHLYKFTKKELG